MRVTVDCGLSLTAIVTRRQAEEMKLNVGLNVVAAVDSGTIRMIPRH